ncbi:MAG: hypothetical protein EZS28_035326 [Streblomastix strix]|uniref:SPRY domain-containing protein n=1 Tax=Streblomastix strix TaxID=222440 RepID=A0A5J4UFE7_9EUKA|nr:MAG: hypothetical protein EZS28_035326 [Streblomastix strix]
MIDKIKKNKVSEVPDWVSNQMKEVIKWMMNQNENHRPTTKMILSHDTVLMYLRSCEDREQSKQEKIEAFNERDLLIEERNGLQSDNERALAGRDQERIEKDRLQIELSRERIEKDLLQIELNRQIQERNALQSDNERALAERDRERIEKDQLQIELNRERIEKDQQKRRADSTQSELDRQKTKTNESQELVNAFQQQIEATQSDNTRLTTENQHLQTELSKLRPLTTSPKQQSKLEPKHQQIQQQIPIPSNTQQSDNHISLQQMSFVQPAVIRGAQIGQSVIVSKPLPKEQSKAQPKHQQIQQQVPPSLNPNMLVGIIPNKQHVYQQGLKIIRTDKYDISTVAFNPIISSGIVRFGGFFERHSSLYNFSIGIAESSAIFGSNEWPINGENRQKTVCYWKDGGISHIGPVIPENSKIELNKSVSCEVNMNISPRTLTFFYDDQEQGLSVKYIPSSIRFYIFLWDANSSFTINGFENLQYSSAKKVSNGKVFEWGKEWKQ